MAGEIKITCNLRKDGKKRVRAKYSMAAQNHDHKPQTINYKKRAGLQYSATNMIAWLHGCMVAYTIYYVSYMDKNF